MKKKKTIIFSLSLGLIIIIALICVIAIWQVNRHNRVKPIEIIIDGQVNPEIEVYQPQPIPLEMMDDEEKTELNLSPELYQQIQVIERNEDGSVATYRIINSENDILTEYQRVGIKKEKRGTKNSPF